MGRPRTDRAQHRDRALCTGLRNRRAQEPRRLALVLSPLAAEKTLVRQRLTLRGGRGFEFALQMFRECGDGGMIEQLGQIDEPGELAVHVLVNLDELERACADFE